MKNTRASLITQTQPLKLPRLNNSMITKQVQHFPSRRDKFFIRPQMKKILYSPFQDNKKSQKNHIMIQSCITNRNYNDITQEHVQKKIQKTLIETDMMNLNDKFTNIMNKNKTLVGKQAPFAYYGEYKKLGKLIAKAHCNKENFSQSPYLAMLQKTQKYDILPLCMGLIKFQGDQNILNLNNYNLGDNYIISLSAGLKNAKLIQKCFLSNNRITNTAMNQLTKSLHQQISVLDVSFNNITHLQTHLFQLIINSQARLQKLNLQKNQIKSQEVIQTLINNVMYSKHLKVLNLRGNGIGSNCANVIGELIDKETGLEELYIGSNFINDGTQIFQYLSKNKNIKVFDYSMNNLGEDQTHSSAKSIANCLTKNKTLHHLDISNNNFNQQASKIISQGLQPNRKLYGFHYNGNFGYVDSRGFLIIQQKQITSLHSLVEKNIDSYQICYKRQNISTAPQMYKNVCWICQGWYQQQFKFNIPQDYKQQKRLVYLHFDFQLYSPRLINITDKHVKYITMVPPKKYKYFFTFNNQQFIDKNTKNQILEFPEEFTYEMYHVQTKFKVQNVSVRKGKPKKIVNDWNQIVISTLPRNTGLVSKKQKQVWTYDKSIWAKQWKLENQDMLKKCFQRDWKCSKLMNLVKNQTDQDKLKQKLYQNYKSIKLTYKYFSSWSPFGDIWAVSNNSWTQFCQQSKIISKDTPLKITDLTFITTNSMSGADWKGNQLVPERGLVRFQFMQALVRLSQEKFKKNGLTQTFTDSIHLLLKDHVLPLAATITQDRWRGEKYFVEENDMLVKKYRPIFMHVYKKNSKLKVKPGEKPFMCLSEFKGIMEKANIAGSLIIQRDIFLSFNFSMMTQVDQLQNEKFIKMTQIQFIQAVARCSQVLPKTCTLSKNPQNQYNLHNKFQWLINQIKITQCSEEIKNQFTEEGSIFNQIEEDQ